MKARISLFLFLIAAVYSRAGIIAEKSYPDFYISETKANKQLISQQCQVILNFNFGVTSVAGRRIYMSINGVLENLVVTSAPVLYDLNPGKYVFKIWGGPGYQEIITDSIEFTSQTTSTANVHIRQAYQLEEVMKPVIYFHTDQSLNVSVNVEPVGEFTFTYPEIKNGWNGKVNEDGTFSMNGMTYPYLFWESDQAYSFKPADNGFKVERENMISFLEKKCAEFGFSQNEKTDFITFWGPRLSASEAVFVQFNVNENCNQYAELTISPAPVNTKRVYIEFTPWSDVMQPYLKDKTFSFPTVKGFTVFEWGGVAFTLPETAYTN